MCSALLKASTGFCRKPGIWRSLAVTTHFQDLRYPWFPSMHSIAHQWVHQQLVQGLRWKFQARDQRSINVPIDNQKMLYLFCLCFFNFQCELCVATFKNFVMTSTRPCRSSLPAAATCTHSKDAIRTTFDQCPSDFEFCAQVAFATTTWKFCRFKAEAAWFQRKPAPKGCSSCATEGPPWPWVAS